MSTTTGAPLSVAIIDYQDTWTTTKGLGQSLTDMGHSYTDLTPGLLAGGTVNLTGFNTFIIGSHCTQNDFIRGAVVAAKTNLHAFVAGGGAMIMLTQADQNRADEDWFQPPAIAHRCDDDFADVKRIQAAHPLFTTPNAITDADLSGWTYNNGWATSWESFNVYRGMGVLAGNHATAPTLGTIIEAAWGQGRAVLVAMAPDKARNVGNAQALAQGPRLMRNLVSYAQAIVDGTAPAITVYTNPLRIAIIDYQDAFTSTKGLGQSLTDLGQSYTDLTAGLVGGGAINLTGFNTVIIGSFASENATIRAAIEAGEPTLKSFVSNGGTVLMLTQADQNRAPEDWLQSPAAARRSDVDFPDVKRLQAGHRIFTTPNAITDANLSGWGYNSYVGSWESFDLYRGVGVLAGNHATSPTLGTLLEAGWGYGRTILCALAPDKARNIGNAQAKAQAPRLLANLLRYATDAQNSGVPAIVVYENPLSIAIIDYADQYSQVKGLGTLLTSLGIPFTDITATLTAGNPFNLSGYNTLIVGSLCSNHATIKSTLVSGASTLQSFVNSGGTIIMLTQADQDRANESWLPAPASVVRGDSDFDVVRRIQAGHQVFHSPNTIAEVDLAGWQYNSWPTSWESFSTYQNVGVLAGNHPVAPTLAAIIEAGWGYGRTLLLSMAPDKAMHIGNPQALAQAPRITQNLLRYAADVQNGQASPVILHTGSGYSGPIKGFVFNDLNFNGNREPGEPGIGGVGVSDSVDLVLTAVDGSYTLPNSANNATLVYISIPSGWAKGTSWYWPINAASVPADFDFALTASDESDPFEFVQVSDIHVGGSGNRALYTEAIARIGALTNPPEFILATGDLTNVGANTSEYDDYSAAIATTSVPLFNVFGNHDANGGGTGNYRNYLGPDYYSFSYGDCHFLIVNSVHRTAAQAAWIAADLAQLRGSKRLFIFQHYSPSQAEHDEFAEYNAEAVFSGHWHSQHSVPVGAMRSYNSPTLLFGGIDCSPASFKVISVNASDITTRTRCLADGKRLQIVSPGSNLLAPRAAVPIAVNAYETSADISGVTYTIRQGTQTIAAGNLVRHGDWSWTTKLVEPSLVSGMYTLDITATNDKGENNSASTAFAVLNRCPARPATTGDWPQFGGGPKRGGLVTNATITPPLGVAWMVHTNGTIDFGSPVLYQNTVFVGVKDRGDFANNGVLALDARDGSRKWFAWTPAAVSHSVAVEGSKVYAASYGGLLHFLNQSTGAELQQRTLGSPYQRFLYGAPVVSGNRVYAGTYAYFAAFDTTSATQQWSQSYGGDWISCNAAPATDGNTVVVPANWSGNSLRGVSAANGGTIWQIATNGLHGSPVIAGSSVVFTTYNGKINAVGLANGESIWSVSVDGPSATTPAVSGNTVVAGGTGSVKAFRLDNGQSLWTFPIDTSPLKMSPYNNTYASLVGSPTIVGTTVYVPSGDGRLYALGLSSGSLLWSMDFGTPILSAPCISGNALYLTTFDGHVYALTDSTGFGPPPDFDIDTDVDLDDLLHFIGCMTGSALAPLPTGCANADLDSDGDVDLDDFAVFQRCLSGTGTAASSACAD